MYADDDLKISHTSIIKPLFKYSTTNILFVITDNFKLWSHTKVNAFMAEKEEKKATTRNT